MKMKNCENEHERLKMKKGKINENENNDRPSDRQSIRHFLMRPSVCSREGAYNDWNGNGRARQPKRFDEGLSLAWKQLNHR